VKDSSSAGRVLRPDAATVRLHDPAADVEPEAHAARSPKGRVRGSRFLAEHGLGRIPDRDTIKLLEDQIKGLGWYSGSRIGDAYMYLTLSRPEGHPERGVAGGVLDAVGDQVLDHLAQLLAVAQDPQLARERAPGAGAGSRSAARLP
jgi:hypothetical protein